MKSQVEDLAKELSRGVEDIKPNGQKGLVELLKKVAEEKRPLRIKLGIDPTSTDLHLGHMVCIQKLKQFQEAGHQVVLVIGGFTAQVGDPSGRNEARPPLTKEEVEINAKTYIDQVAKVLDMSKIEIVNNADWFDKFTMVDMLKLAGQVTINQMIAKEAFGKRLDDGLPLYMHETYYPLLQGYDSVEIRADIELGGTDQTFNLLVGRDLQKAYGQPQQMAMTMPLLVGLDGQKKMSKTSNNFIALTDEPSEMFGKTMSIPDELIPNYYLLAANASSEEAEQIEKQLKDAAVNPRDLKVELAKRIVAIYYSETDANAAEEGFIKQFKEHKIPDDIPEFKLDSTITLADLMVQSKLCASKGEAKRLIAGGGVKLDGEKLDDFQEEISLNGSGEKVLQVGKRKFIKLVK